MKITFIVPALNLTGGLRVISIYANLLSKRGHTVTVISPNEKKPTLKEKIKSLLHWKGYVFYSGFNNAFFKNPNYEVMVLKEGLITAEDVPDSDVIIATFWATAEWISGFPEEKGRKVYFIQHHEIHPWLPVKRVKDTFKLPFKKVVVAQWLADVLMDNYKQSDVSVVTNAVDHDLFHAPTRQKSDEVTFGMMYSGREYKGSQQAFECFNELKIKYPFINLVLFGIESEKDVVGLPAYAEYISQPDQEKIRDIYTECDAWLFTSKVEGFGLPILEAMACRTPVIGTRCGAAPDLLMTGGGVLVEVDDQAGFLRAMETICMMTKNEWLGMSSMAHQEALSHRWEVKVAEFERAIG